MRILGIISNLFRPKKWGGSWFYPYDAGNVWKDLDYVQAFQRVPEVNAVLNADARAFSSGVLKVVNDKGETQEKDPVHILLQNPNWFQAQKEFLRQTRLFHNIFGNEYLYMLFPVGFKANRTSSLFTIPPNLICPEFKSTSPFFTYSKENPPEVTYKLSYGAEDKYIPAEQIVHLNDNRVHMKTGTDKDMLKGESKLQALRSAIHNIEMAYESRHVILKHRGALGILSNAASDAVGTVVLDDPEKKKIQDDYRNSYGGLAHQNQLIITNANLKWQQMGVNPDKLGLFQEIEADFKRILDAYGWQEELFATGNPVTYENKKQAEKGIYQNNIIPSANEWCTALNSRLMVNSKNSIVMDFTHLPIFQEDIKMRADALTSMVNSLSKMLTDGAITIDEYKEEIGRLFGIVKK